jgi:RNA polymerase sigma-70 factor (ECF subfamily)
MRLLFGRHSVTVYRFALRIVANEAAAEDVVSEVFADVWRKAAAFEGRSKVSTWLLAITRHKALEIARRRTPEALDDDAYDAVEDEADNPETAMQKKQCGSILQKCLKDLSPAHREIIDLVYYHQKSIGEIAKIIHVPRSTVKTRMFYARNHLANRLAEAGYDRRLLHA